MSARELRVGLASLRKAGRDLRRKDRAEVVEALAQVFDDWARSGSRWQRALVEELPSATGFTSPMVREAAAQGFAPYSGKALRALFAAEIEAVERHGGTRASGFETTAVMLAGAIPMPTLVGVAMPLALRSPVWLRPSQRDPVTPRLVVETIAAVDAQLADCVFFAAFDREDEASLDEFLQAEAVVVTGSDATVAEVARRCPPGTLPVAYGHRFSVAVLGPEATAGSALREVAAGLARDVAFWDQLGCLSPVALWVVDPDPRATARVHETLAEAFAEAEARWPRGEMELSSAAVLRGEREAAAMRKGVNVQTGAGNAWTLIGETDPRHRAAPLHRFFRVHPCQSLAQWEGALAPYRPQIAAVAAAGFDACFPALLESCARLGASRICAPGTMQTPPLAWHHDNRGVLTPLVRWCDLELL